MQQVAPGVMFLLGISIGMGVSLILMVVFGPLAMALGIGIGAVLGLIMEIAARNAQGDKPQDE